MTKKPQTLADLTREFAQRGGRSRSLKKLAAIRENAKKGGRSRRICAVCSEPVGRSYHADPTLDTTCPGRPAGSRWQTPSERRRDQ